MVWACVGVDYKSEVVSHVKKKYVANVFGGGHLKKQDFITIAPTFYL